MTDEEEKCFWLRQDLASSKVLEWGILPEDVQIEDVGEWVTWGPAIEPVLEGPPLVLDFVTPWHILAYNFQTMHISINIC